jgi:hypothetical protein
MKFRFLIRSAGIQECFDPNTLVKNVHKPSFEMTADPDQLTPILEAKLRSVSGAIVNKPPLCSGTWETPSESFQLFFKNGGDSAKYMNPVLASSPHLISLVDGLTCSTRLSHNSNRLPMHVLQRHLERTIRTSWTCLTARPAKWMSPTLCRGLMQTV